MSMLSKMLSKRAVNEKFAAITLDALRRMTREAPKNKPIVWIHDYHLMVAANTIRQVQNHIVLHTIDKQCKSKKVVLNK